MDRKVPLAQIQFVCMLCHAAAGCAVLSSDLLCCAMPNFVLLYHVSLLCGSRPALCGVCDWGSAQLPDDVQSFAYLLGFSHKALCHANCTVQQ